MYLSQPHTSATQPSKTKRVVKGRNTYLEAKNVETRRMKKLKSQTLPQTIEILSDREKLKDESQGKDGLLEKRVDGKENTNVCNYENKMELLHTQGVNQQFEFDDIGCYLNLD